MDLFENVVVEENGKPILKKIILQNYRNIDYKEILVGEHGLILQGKNGLGKTNIIEAVYRNMSGKLFSGSAKSDSQAVTPVDKPRAETSVKLVFDKNNFTFELISYEDYAKKDDSYKGTAYNYYVNEAVTKKGQAMEMLFDYLGIKATNDLWSKDERKNIDLIGLLFNISYLKEVDYKYLRTLVIDMVGDVSFVDVINENPVKYGKLVQPLKDNGMSLEVVKAKNRVEKLGKSGTFGLEDKIRSTKDNIKVLEVKASATYDLSEITIAKNSMKELENKIVDLRVKKQKGASELTSDIDLQIATLERDLMTEQHRIQVEHNKLVESLKDNKLEKDILDKQESVRKLRNDRLSVNEKLSTKNSELYNNNSTISTKKDRIVMLNTKRKELLDKYNAIKSPSTSEQYTCPCCDKPFHLHETKEHKAIIEKQLGEIAKQGGTIKPEIEGLNEGIKTLEIKVELIQNEILKLQTEREQIESNIENLEKEVNELIARRNQTTLLAPILDLNGGNVQSIKSKIETLKTSKLNVMADYAKTINDIELQIVELETQKQPLQEVINKEIVIENYCKDLEAERKSLDKLEKDLVDVDDILMLIKDVEQEKYTRIEQKIANTFGENIKFELFKENVDGTVDTRVCVMLVKDIRGNFVRIENLNTGLYPIRALEFIESVRNFYNIPKSFIFVDELSALDTEHTQKLLASGLQIIATRPSDSDKLEEIKII
jgi:chromosome segregation ATPase